MNRSRFTDIICAMVQLNSKVSPHSVASSSAIDTANHPEIVELLKQSNTESKGEWISVDVCPKVEGFLKENRYTYFWGYFPNMGLKQHMVCCNIMPDRSFHFDEECTHYRPLPPKPKEQS